MSKSSDLDELSMLMIDVFLFLQWNIMKLLVKPVDIVKHPGAFRVPFGGRSKASCCCSGVIKECKVMSL